MDENSPDGEPSLGTLLLWEREQDPRAGAPLGRASGYTKPSGPRCKLRGCLGFQWLSRGCLIIASECKLELSLGKGVPGPEWEAAEVLMQDNTEEHRGYSTPSWGLVLVSPLFPILNSYPTSTGTGGAQE